MGIKITSYTRHNMNPSKCISGFACNVHYCLNKEILNENKHLLLFLTFNIDGYIFFI